MATRQTIASSSLFRRSTLHGSESRRLLSSSSKSEKPGDRLSMIIDAVNERKLAPEVRGRGNTVRIWHSMLEGDFENLPGKGRPLDLKNNPHADPADDTLYRILAKNG